MRKVLMAVIYVTSLATMAAAQDVANLWIDTTGGSCTRSATPVSYNGATACATVAAAWSAAQGGDTIIAKGGTYSSGFSASGAKSSTVTVRSATGENAWFAGSGSLSGVTNMTVTDERGVDMTTEQGMGQGLTMGLTGIGGASANIIFNNIDIWCQNQAPWHLVTGGRGTKCSVTLTISGVNGFTMRNGSLGPESDCENSPCSGATDISKITACASNAACNNITFDHVLFHDAENLDSTTGMHHEMWKIDQGQNISFLDSKFVRCNAGVASCSSAAVFLGASGSSQTADHITAIGNVGYDVNGGFFSGSYCQPGPCNPTMTFKYNTFTTQLNNQFGAPVNSYAGYTFVGNTAFRTAVYTCSGTFSDNTWFATDGSTPAQCPGDNNGATSTANFWVSSTDYHLRAGSPLISAGGTGCLGLKDIAGNVRTTGTCDVGAYGYSTGTSTPPPTGGTPPAPPSNLTAVVH
jgi:hypothetical protein